MKKNNVLELEDAELTEFANELSGYMSSIIKDKGLPEELTVNSSANCYNAVDMTNAAVFGLEYALDLMEKEHKADIETIRKIADEEIEKFSDELAKAFDALDNNTDDVNKELNQNAVNSNKSKKKKYLDDDYSMKIGKVMFDLATIFDGKQSLDKVVRQITDNGGVKITRIQVSKLPFDGIDNTDDVNKELNQTESTFYQCVKRATEANAINGVTAAFAKLNPNIQIDTYDNKSFFEFVFGEYYTPLARMIMDIYIPTHNARKIFEENGINLYKSSDGKRNPFIKTFLCLYNFFIKNGKKANAYKGAIFTSQGLRAFNEMENFFISNHNDNLCEFCDTLDAFANFILK